MQCYAPRASGILAAFLLIAGFGFTPQISTGAEPARYDLKISSQSLDEALQAFARQSGIQIVFFSHLADGQRAPELAGEYTLASAMERLLSGTGLDYRVVNPETVEVRQLAAESPSPDPASRAQSTRSVDNEIEEVRIVGIAEQLVVTRVPTPLEEIPQSISVVSREQMAQQNDVNLTDVLRHATGITIRRDSSVGEQLYARSFRVTSIHVDGGAGMEPQLPEPFSLTSTPDLSEFDHVEILRGSDALFAGDSNPGATVSLVRKRPLPRFQALVSGTLGSWNNRQVEVDISGPIARDGALRARADAMYLDTDYFFDTAHLERKKVFGVVEYDFTPQATLTVGASVQTDDALPWEGGLPIDTRGGDPNLPRHTALTFDWAFVRTRANEGYVQYRQQIARGWNIRFNAAVWRHKMSYAYGVFTTLFDAPKDDIDSPFALFSGKPSRFTTETADLTLTGVFQAFGMRQEFAVGADFRHLKGYWDAWNTGFGDIGNFSSFDPRNYEDPRLFEDGYLRLDGISTIDQQGEFASLRVHLNDAWSITAGARISGDSLSFRQKVYFDSRFLRDAANEYGTSKAVTPFGGLLYRFADRYSWYASYSDIYDSVFTHERESGGLIGPAHGVNLETGIKGVWRDGALHGSLALFRVRQRDLSVYDPEVYYDERPFCCYLSANARARGAELELAGQLAPGWLVGSGYTYTLLKPDLDLDQAHLSPRHLLKFWTSVQLRGDFARWTVGGSLEGESRTKTGAAVYCGEVGCPELVQKSYAVLGLRAAFRVDDTWQLALSVNNVFDKNYYESVEPYELRSWYGPPRNFVLRINGRF